MGRTKINVFACSRPNMEKKRRTPDAVPAANRH